MRDKIWKIDNIKGDRSVFFFQSSSTVSFQVRSGMALSLLLLAAFLCCSRPDDRKPISHFVWLYSRQRRGPINFVLFNGIRRRSYCVDWRKQEKWLFNGDLWVNSIEISTCRMKELNVSRVLFSQIVIITREFECFVHLIYTNSLRKRVYVYVNVKVHYKKGSRIIVTNIAAFLQLMKKE